MEPDKYIKMCGLMDGSTSLEDIAKFTTTERVTIQREIGLNLFDPKRRNSKGKLYASLTQALFGRAVFKYDRKSKRFDMYDYAHHLVSLFYVNMRTSQNCEDKRANDEDDEHFRQKCVRFV
jgi:hypothetical protein